MKHHLIKKKTWHLEHEDSEKIRCSYCGAELAELESEHDRHFHYKGTVCDICGKKVWAKMAFIGCGKDKLPPSKLEKKVA